MTLISIILALFAERFIGSLEDYRSFSWFNRYTRWVVSKGPKSSPVYSWMALIVSVVTPALLVLYGYHAVYKAFSPAGFIFATAILFYCFGPKTFYEKVKDFMRAADSGNTESATWYAEILLERPLSDQEKSRLSYTVTETLFVIAHDRVLGIIFWFAVFGPFGALMFRLASELHKTTKHKKQYSDSFSRAVATTYFILSWVPARLAALAFIVTGNFVDGMASFKNKGTMCSTRWRNPNECILAASGCGAIGIQPDETGRDRQIVLSAFSLVRRSIVFSIGVIALLTLSGALG